MYREKRELKAIRIAGEREELAAESFKLNEDVRVDETFTVLPSLQVAPAFEEVGDLCAGLGRIKVVRHPELADADQVASRRLIPCEEHEIGRRLAVPRDDDLFPALGGGDESGEVSFRVMDVDFHVLRLVLSYLRQVRVIR